MSYYLEVYLGGLSTKMVLKFQVPNTLSIPKYPLALMQR